jgi:hypothetical protein
MTNDLSLIVGEIRGAQKAIEDRLDRQDRATESNKKAAIAAREDQHAEYIKRFDVMGVRIDGIDGRVTVLEGDKKVEQAESRGRKAAFGIIYAAIGAGLTALGAVSGDAIGAIRELLHG